MDPLAQLKDIHLPEQIANYPLAPGWWILAALVIAIITWLFIVALKSYRLNKAKRQALKMLNTMDTSTVNQNDNIMNLLKWAALQYFPRQTVAPLFGEQLQQFMISCLPSKQQGDFAEQSQPAFTSRYTKNELATTDDQLKQAAQLWIKHALPPQNNKTAQHSDELQNDNTAQIATATSSSVKNSPLSSGASQ